MYPDHCWYAVATSGQVTTDLSSIRFLGEEIILRRSADGIPYAFHARCAHRGCSLANGRTTNEQLVCPYHGWRYNSQGECVHIPSLCSGESIPAQARIQTYPLSEANGFVWLWRSTTGMPASESVPSLPELSGLNLHAGGDISFHYQTNYTRTLENGIDPTHAVFVHGASIGRVDAKADLRLEPYTLTCNHGSIYARMPIKVKKINGLTGLLLRGSSNPFKEYTFLYPNLVVSTIHFGRFTLSALQAHVPENEHSTTVRVTNARNFLRRIPFLSSWFDGVVRSTGVKISTEDEAVISDQLPREVVFKGSGEVLVRSDEILVAFRRMMRERIYESPASGLLTE